MSEKKDRMNQSDIELIIEKINSLTTDQTAVLLEEMCNLWNIDFNNLGNMSNTVEEEEVEVVSDSLKTLILTSVPEEKEEKIIVMRILTKLLDMNLLKCKQALDNLPLVVRENLKADEIKEIKDMFSNIKNITFEEK